MITRMSIPVPRSGSLSATENNQQPLSFERMYTWRLHSPELVFGGRLLLVQRTLLLVCLFPCRFCSEVYLILGTTYRLSSQ